MMAIEQHEVAVVWRLWGAFVAAMIVVVGDDDHNRPLLRCVLRSLIEKKM